MSSAPVPRSYKWHNTVVNNSGNGEHSSQWTDRAVNTPNASSVKPYSTYSGQHSGIADGRKSSRTAMNHMSRGKDHFAPADDKIHPQFTQQAPQNSRFSTPHRTPEFQSELVRLLTEYVIQQQSPPDHSEPVNPNPVLMEFPNITAFIEKQNADTTGLMPIHRLPLYDYVFSDFTFGKPLSFTAVELITFLPHLCRSKGIATRLLNGGMQNTTHFEIHNTHRHTNDGIAITSIAGGYLDAMRGAGWRVRPKEQKGSWSRKGHKPPKNWVCSLDMAGFQPDRIKHGGGMAPDPVPFSDLLKGVKKVPTGFDAADLTRAIEYAIGNPNEDGREWIFPTDLSSILDYIGRTIVTPEYQDSKAALRYDRQYKKRPTTPKSKLEKVGYAAPDSQHVRTVTGGSNPSPKPQVHNTSPQSELQMFHANLQVQPITQATQESNQSSRWLMHTNPPPAPSMASQDPVREQPTSAWQSQPIANGLMRHTVVQGDEASLVNRLILFAQRPDQERFDWLWTQEHIDVVQSMLSVVPQVGTQAAGAEYGMVQATGNLQPGVTAQQHQNTGVETPVVDMTAARNYDPDFWDPSGPMADSARANMTMTAGEYEDVFGQPAPPHLPVDKAMPVMSCREELQHARHSFDEMIAMDCDQPEHPVQFTTVFEEDMRGHDPADLLRNCVEADDVLDLTLLAEAARIARSDEYIHCNWHVRDMLVLLDADWRKKQTNGETDNE